MGFYSYLTYLNGKKGVLNIITLNLFMNSISSIIWSYVKKRCIYKSAIFFLSSPLILCFLQLENHFRVFQDFRQLLRDGRLTHYNLVLLSTPWKKYSDWWKILKILKIVIHMLVSLTCIYWSWWVIFNPVFWF